MLTDNLWFLAGAVLTVVTVLTLILDGVKRFARGRVSRWLSKTPTALDDLIGFVLDRTGFFLVLCGVLWFAVSGGHVPPERESAVRTLAVVAFFIQLTQWGMAAVTFAAKHFTSRASSHAVAATAVGAFSFVARLVIVSVLLLAALMNIGVNVTALLTGLGIGGIAVALAVQTLLRDLLGTVHIVIAKPFLIGDLIEVGSFIGTVRAVGLRSTTLTNLPGEDLILPNNCVLESPLRNHSRMIERRVSDLISISYATNHARGTVIGTLIRESVEAVEKTRFERAHLKRFGTWGLEYEFVYWVLTADYDVYMQLQHEVNLGLMKRLEDLDIDFGAEGFMTSVVGQRPLPPPRLAR